MSVIKYNNNNINKIVKGSTVKKMYYGGNLAFLGFDEVEPTFNGKWKLTLSDSSTVSAECDSTSAITNMETSGYSSSTVSVVIGDCVTTIKNNAFRNRTSLSSVTIPDSVTTIEFNSFSGCSSLTSVTIPSGVTSIEFNSFDGCSGLTSVTIPSAVTSIGTYAFRNCTSLSSVTLPNSVTSIGDGAFRNCTSLSSVTLPSGVTTIGNSAFYNCSGLTSIEIPSSVTSIDNYIFYGCSGLTSVTIPSAVTSIGYGAFQDCTSLISMTLPNSVTSIGTSAFQDCRGLSIVTLSSGITTINDSAFRNCTSLSSVTLPSGVTTIGGSAFYNCSGLTNITVETTTPTSIGNAAFDNTNNCPIYVPCESYEDYYVSWTAYADRIALENGQIVWTETTDTICQLGELYAIETLEKWSCDGGTTWYTPTQTITRIGRDLGETCSASYVFDASEVYNSGISYIEYGTPYVSPSGFEFIVEGIQCVVNTNAVNISTRYNPYPVIFTTTNSDAIHDITFVTTNSVALQYGFTTNIDNNVDDTNINDDYNNTSGSCTVDGTTRYWKRYEVMEGHTPFTSVRLKRTSIAINLMFAGINTDSDWVNNLPPS